MNSERIEQLKESFERSKMMAEWGAVLRHISPGSTEIILQKKEFMARPAGMFNGGIIAALVDTASGYAAASSKAIDSYFVTVELKVNYLNPASGDFLLAKAEVIKNGKVISVVRTDIYAVKDDQQVHAATSLVTMMQLRNKNK